jgi:cell wall-associated NlpC family hydrolase
MKLALTRTVTTAAVLLACPATALARVEGPPIRPVRHPATLASHVAHIAPQFRGTPYVWAGTSPAGFDCSGFTRYLYANVGIELPHSTYAQWDMGRHIDAVAKLRPGDLVFFGMGHVGIWLGHGRFIHAPHTRPVVTEANITTGWYAATFIGGVRVTGSQIHYHQPATKPRRRHAEVTASRKNAEPHR